MLQSYEIDELEVEEIELLLGERAAADCLVRGLQSDLARYGSTPVASRLHRASAALARVRQSVR